MDIGWAVARLKDGEKVRRHLWATTVKAYDEQTEGAVAWRHLYIEDRDGHAPALMVRHGDGSASHFTMIDFHLLADDWEIA